VIIHRCIDRQRQVGEDFANEEHRARVAREQQRVFAAPAQAAASCEFDLEHRRAVGAHAITEITGGLLDARGQFLQPIAQHLVIVAPARVDRNHRGITVVQARKFALDPLRPIGAWPIVESRADRTHRPLQKLRRVRAQMRVALHVVHLAVPAGGEPFLQLVRRFRHVDCGNGDRTEPEFVPPALDRRGEIDEFARVVMLASHCNFVRCHRTILGVDFLAFRPALPAR